VRRLWALPLALLWTAGCHRHLKAQAEPAVRVEGVDLSFEDDGQATMQLSLSVLNPDARGGKLARLEWELWLAGRLFAEGAQSVDVEVPAQQRRALDLQLPLLFRRRTLVDEPRRTAVGVRGRIEQVAGGDRTWQRFDWSAPLTLPRSPATDVDED
jgi:hypothetical protein